MPRQRVPARLRLIEGTFRSDRHNAFEPMTTGAASETPPRHLSTGAKKCWCAIVGAAPEHTLRNADEFLLEVVAGTLSDYRELTKAARAAPLIERSPNGDRINVLRTEARKIAATLHRMLSELGYTPASRSRIIADEPHDDVELRRFGASLRSKAP